MKVQIKYFSQILNEFQSINKLIDGRKLNLNHQQHLLALCVCVFVCAPCQVIEYNPSQCLDWLAVQTPRNKLAHSWVLQNMENWVERFLLAHNYPRVRTCKRQVNVKTNP